MFTWTKVPVASSSLVLIFFFLAHPGRRVDRLRVPTRHEQSSEEQGQEDGQAGGQAALQGHGLEREEVRSFSLPGMLVLQPIICH